MSSSKKINDVFLKMQPHISPINPGESNFVFSPLSLRLLVSLIASGASGPNLDELLSFLDAPSLNVLHDRVSELAHLEKESGFKFKKVTKQGNDVVGDGGPKVSLANALWIDERHPILASYDRIMKRVYNASSFQVDFLKTEGDEIVREVNSWGEEKTNGLVKEAIPLGSVQKDTKLILANALYFKGKWQDEYFKASHTKDGDFHLLSQDSVKVPFMTSYHKHYIEDYTDFQSLYLPYKRKAGDAHQFSMLVLLPKEKYGLAGLMEKVTSGGRAFLDHHVACSAVRVGNFKIPRFQISFGFEGTKILKQFGMSLAFQMGGLNNMVEKDSELLYVSKVFHKCFIEVNEEGTEAAAISVGKMRLGCSAYRPPPLDFVADHPFMFLIREDVTGVVLFIGHVLNPLLS